MCSLCGREFWPRLGHMSLCLFAPARVRSGCGPSLGARPDHLGGSGLTTRASLVCGSLTMPHLGNLINPGAYIRALLGLTLGFDLGGQLCVYFVCTRLCASFRASHNWGEGLPLFCCWCPSLRPLFNYLIVRPLACWPAARGPIHLRSHIYSVRFCVF